MRADVESASEERSRTADIVADYIPPPPTRSRELFDNRWENMEFDTLLIEEQRYILVWAMRAEINNGGFGSFFFNSSGDTALETLSALKQSGSSEVQQILGDAIAVLDDVGGYSTERQTRVKRLNLLPDDCFLEVNRRFYETGEDVAAIAFAMVESVYSDQSLI